MKTVKRFTVLAAVISFVAFHGFSQVAPAAAKDNQQKTQSTVNKAPGTFVDNNRNGICDNHECKMINGKCANFVDKNKDGICDNKENCCKGKEMNGCGQGCRNHQDKEQGNCCGKGNMHGRGCMNQKAAPEPPKSNEIK